MHEEYKLENVAQYKERTGKEDSAAKVFYARMIRAGVFPSCINCEYFNHINETCDKVNQRPPAHIIVSGCPEWQQEIPF